MREVDCLMSHIPKNLEEWSNSHKEESNNNHQLLGAFKAHTHGAVISSLFPLESKFLLNISYSHVQVLSYNELL